MKDLCDWTLEEQQEALEFRKTRSSFIEHNLDMYGFSYVLFQSLLLDGFDVKTKNPNQILELLGSFIQQSDVDNHHIIQMHINDMDDSSYQIYPVGETVLIHPAVLIHFIHEFIYAIGSELLEMPNETDGRLYSYWMKKEDVYTYAFLDKFFRDFTKILSQIGPFKDSLISLQLTGKHEINFVDVVRIAGEKESRYNEMKDRIGVALSQKFYLEAIVLEESSISDRLAMALFVRGVQASSKNFASLIDQCSDDLPSGLREELDQWRDNRNKAVHGLVRSSPLEELIDIETLDQLTEQTAVQGMELNNTINAWFEDLIMYEMNPYCFRVPDTKVVIH